MKNMVNLVSLLKMFTLCMTISTLAIHVFIVLYHRQVVIMKREKDQDSLDAHTDKKADEYLNYEVIVSVLTKGRSRNLTTYKDIHSKHSTYKHGVMDSNGSYVRDYVSWTYGEMDLMKLPQIKFDPKFKNPCWHDKKKLVCLPYMFIIGVKKCGTSDLFFRTAMHPDFAHPGFKEAQWFARRRFTKDKSMADFSAYISMFDKAANKVYKGAELMPHESFTNQRTITGEASPSNLHLNSHWQTLPGNENADEPRYVILDYIHHILPAAKIIITFRDPIDRLYSDYFHEFGTLQNRNDVGPAHFHEVVTEGIDLYRKCFEHRTVRSCAYDHSLYDTTKMQVQLGIYYIYWQELTRLFSRDNILVLQNKDMKYKERTMKMVYNFLGLRELTAVEMQSVVKSQEQYIRKASYKEKGPMLKETRELLTEFYQPFNEKMAELTGDSQFLYMDTS